MVDKTNKKKCRKDFQVNIFKSEECIDYTHQTIPTVLHQAFNTPRQVTPL